MTAAKLATQRIFAPHILSGAVMARKSSLTRVSIVNAEFFGHHGVREEEKALGGRYQVDADVYYDATIAALNDAITDAIDYEQLLYLIETLATDIASEILDRYEKVQQVTIRIRKLSLPIQTIIECVEAEYSAVRE
jgi:dihydroneopterin aldolase